MAIGRDLPAAIELFADPIDPLIWKRGEDALIGVGASVWRGEFQGESRLLDAAQTWRDIAATAEVSDAVNTAGTGLVAFGALAFSPASKAPSVLIVPERIIGRVGGVTFITAVTADGSTPEPEMPTPIARGTLPVARLEDGVMTEDAHREAIIAAKERIDSGRISKIVIARDVRGSIAPDADRRLTASRLASAYPTCSTYAVDGLIGATPETLVRARDGEITARVLAGTAPRSANATEDRRTAEQLITSTKDLAEHAYAIDSARESLIQLDPDITRALTVSEKPFLLELPNVWHLASDVRGQLPDQTSVLDLVTAIHPTAAVGGTPRDVALPMIDELEPFDRRRYAGPVGWVSADGDGEFAVALRGAEFERNGTVTAFAGGGIVSTSDEQAEFHETEWKLKPIREALSAVRDRE